MSITVEIAQHAVALTAAYLLFESGREAMTIARDEGGRLLTWLREKLPAPGQTALDDLQSAPTDTESRANLGNEVTRLLTNDPRLLGELRELLPHFQPDIAQTSSHNVGSTILQNTGNNVTITTK